MRRPGVIPLCLFIFLVASTATAASDAATIVRNGEPQAVIVVQPDAPAQLSEAVSEMQRLIQHASGAKIEITEQVPDGFIAIHVGHTITVEALKIDLGILDGDGFVIQFPDRQTIFILGPTDWGTEFGVYDFLERYLGVRWLMPGPDGTYVPQKATVTVPREPVRGQPAFFSRKFFGLRLEQQQLWARRNRLHSRVEFHHQLNRLFPRSDIEKHPELFPIHNGKRYLPPATAHYHGWQPCFTAPRVVDIAAERIIAYFDQHPEAESYSLGVTDSGGHCQCDACRALDSGRKNAVNRDHLSDRYFTWANAVMERVLERHPDKWFGCLAYSEIFEPPDRVQVHPRMIPYMTYDRMQWIDPEARAASEELTRRWAKASPVVGWYDYIYGAAYLVPRVYPHLMGEYYRFAHETGVRALTAEAYPNFGEGPKLYVSLRLQWDPSQSVDRLLDEWYELAVGQNAAPYVKKYYEHWEDFWTRRISDANWWSQGRQYLRFNVPTYLEEVTLDEIAQCRDWLEAAVANAGSDRQRARANLLLQAFEYYEASAIAYPRPEPAPKLATETEAERWLERVVQRSHNAQRRRQLSAQSFRNHPFLHHCMDIDRYAAISGGNWGAQDVCQLFDWALRSKTIRGRFQELAERGRSESLQSQAAAMLTCIEPSQFPITLNASFEQGSGGRATGWSVWLQDGVGSLKRTDRMAHSGQFAMLGEGIQYGGPHQSIEFAPGVYCLMARLFIPDGQPPGGFVDVCLRALDDANHNLPGGGTTSSTPTPGGWRTIMTVMDAREPPGGAVRIRAGVWARNFPAEKQIYIDDMNLFRLKEEG